MALLTEVTKGPVAVTLAASSKWFRFYGGGVIDKTCGDTPNHAALLVGYGQTSGGRNYWLIQNTFGEDWGESGYARIAIESVDAP
jgi:C1A family cysteine protease